MEAGPSSGWKMADRMIQHWELQGQQKCPGTGAGVGSPPPETQRAAVM